MSSAVAGVMSVVPAQAGAAIGAGSSVVQRFGFDGKPTTDPVCPCVVHNGMIYISTGANWTKEEGTVRDGALNPPTLDLTTHVTRTMELLKKLLEAAGGDMGHIHTLTVFMATLEFYWEINKPYGAAFVAPNRPPARTAIAVTGIPNGSLFEISCIASVVKA